MLKSSFLGHFGFGSVSQKNRRFGPIFGPEFVEIGGPFSVQFQFGLVQFRFGEQIFNNNLFHNERTLLYFRQHLPLYLTLKATSDLGREVVAH